MATPEELAQARAEAHQYKTAMFALIRSLDRRMEGDALRREARMRIQIEQWHRGELDGSTALAGIYGELVLGIDLPIIDGNLKPRD